MPRLIWLTLALCAAASLGCNPPNPGCDNGGTRADEAAPGIAVAPSAAQVFRAGEEVSVLFQDGARQGSCLEQEETFREARVEVFDPKNEKLTAQVTPSVSGSFVSVQVRFVAPEAGWYHVTAVMDFGSRTPLKQAEVLVTKSRIDASKVELDVPCSAMHQTAAGALVCDAKVFRGGAAVQDLPANARVAVSGNVVWVHASGSLRRYEDKGAGALEQLPAAALSTTALDGQQLLATETELVVLATNGLSQYRFDGTALAEVAFAGYGETFVTDPSRRILAVRAGELVHVLFPTTAGLKTCRYQLGASAISRVQPPCAASASLGVGATSEGFFLQEGQQVRFVVPGADGVFTVKARGTIAAGYTFQFGSGAPTRQAGVIVSPELSKFTGAPPPTNPTRTPWTLPVPSGGDILFEQYETTAEYEFLGANETLAWERTKSVPVKTRVFTR